MQNSTWSQFHRARRFAAPGRAAKARLWIASIAAAVILVLLLLLLSALADLLVTRGTLRISTDEQSQLPAAAGKSDGVDVSSNAGQSNGQRLDYHDRGTLPLVYRLRNTALGSVRDGRMTTGPRCDRIQNACWR